MSTASTLPHAFDGWLAVVVGCADATELDEVLDRWGGGASGQPPLGLVLPRCTELVRRLALATVVTSDVLFEDELEDDAVPATRLERLVAASVYARAADSVVAEYVPELDEAWAEKLRHFLVSGARGRRINGAAGEFGLSASTFRRRFASMGLPTPGALLRIARKTAYAEFLRAGKSPDAAALACGYSRSRWAARSNNPERGSGS